ncbi:MAG: biotin/lipoyl-binding protein [Saprospiraceae bacterium]|nr:biotin/lipoyl-binding protein [Saprospiraceae bacterium]
MLNISENTIQHTENLEQLQSIKITGLSRWHRHFKKLMLALLAIFLLFMFLPWTQNVRADGKVTTLRPEQRPQTIHATISGRIEHWYVTEGQSVRKGDTIVHLSEVKSEYFDPAMVDRVGNQISAKEGSILSYGNKADALIDQISAMEQELESKSKQIGNKIAQARFKIESDSLKVVQAGIDLLVAQRQLNGTQALYDKGLKSLSELEDKRLKLQEAKTKAGAAENQLASSRNDLSIYRTELQVVKNETANKIAKTRSDRFSTLSEQYDARAAVSKLSIDQTNYLLRQSFYYITAPQDGYIVKTIKPGIGEIIKEGDPIVSIQPSDYALAVEMYVRPIDLPLLQVGHTVRFLFDGWPAFFFSGWPGVSVGTYAGKIVAIDRNISANGKFRVLVAQDSTQEPWPNAVQPGGGAKGIALLNDVPVWYEMWRVMNGFPPDWYQQFDAPKPEKNGKGK